MPPGGGGYCPAARRGGPKQGRADLHKKRRGRGVTVRRRSWLRREKESRGFCVKFDSILFLVLKIADSSKNCEINFVRFL